MRIELMTMWYNEEFLAPFFLNHYAWVDRIHIFIDADTTDNTESIARRYPNVEIEYFRFPDKLNDQLKVQEFNRRYAQLKDVDYVLVADSDEFIFCNDVKKSVKTHIEATRHDIYFVHLYQIYKHETDFDLDPQIPVYMQRRHGDSNMLTRENIYYMKPIVARTGMDIRWECGNHSLFHGDTKVAWWEIFKPDAFTIDGIQAINISVHKNDLLQGAHWRLVDLDQTIHRRINNRKNRLSSHNLQTGGGAHYHTVTEADIIAEYEANKNNPIVINSKHHFIDQYIFYILKYFTFKNRISGQMSDLVEGYMQIGETGKALQVLHKAMNQ